MLVWIEEPSVLHAALRPIAHHPQVAPDALTERGKGVNRGLSFAAAAALHTSTIAKSRGAGVTGCAGAVEGAAAGVQGGRQQGRAGKAE